MRLDLWIDWIESDPARLRAELQGAKAILREEIAELRRAIFALRPVAFDELGFLGGLQRYVSEFAGQQGWAATIDLGDAPTALPPAIEATCFRIVQESLTNVAKHAGARRVEVILDGDDGGLRIVVGDDGRGLPAGISRPMARAARASGCDRCASEAAALRGRLAVGPRPGGGTVVRAWLPLPPADTRTATAARYLADGESEG
jgi:signal transduction histidine kinase